MSAEPKPHHAPRAVTVKLFAGLRDLFGQKEVQVPLERAQDLGRLLDSICQTAEQRQALLTGTGAFAPGVIVLLNGRHAALLGGTAAPLAAGDEVALFPPIAGG
jgi:sulfur-carrier protein